MLLIGVFVKTKQNTSAIHFPLCMIDISPLLFSASYFFTFFHLFSPFLVSSAKYYYSVLMAPYFVRL